MSEGANEGHPTREKLSARFRELLPEALAFSNYCNAVTVTENWLSEMSAAELARLEMKYAHERK